MGPHHALRSPPLPLSTLKDPIKRRLFLIDVGSILHKHLTQGVPTEGVFLSLREDAWRS